MDKRLIFQKTCLLSKTITSDFFTQYSFNRLLILSICGRREYTAKFF